LRSFALAGNWSVWLVIFVYRAIMLSSRNGTSPKTSA
jgi:hypothetical protein